MPRQSEGSVAKRGPRKSEHAPTTYTANRDWIRELTLPLAPILARYTGPLCDPTLAIFLLWLLLHSHAISTLFVGVDGPVGIAIGSLFNYSEVCPWLNTCYLLASCCFARSQSIFAACCCLKELDRLAKRRATSTNNGVGVPSCFGPIPSSALSSSSAATTTTSSTALVYQTGLAAA